MKKIEIKLNQDALAPILDHIKPLAGEIRDDLVVEPQLHSDMDADLRRFWKQDLREKLGSDSDALMNLFGRRFFEEGVIEINPDNADAVLRASAAIRLLLRQRSLKHFPDESLESGNVAHNEMSLEEQRSYASYLFLASIQEVVIDHMDIILGNA